MRTTKLHQTGLILLLCQPLLGAGCLITTNSDDESGETQDTGGDPTTVGSFTNGNTEDETSDPDESGSVDETVGETTGTPMGECSESRIVDGGFEAGTPSKVWMEFSDQFETPICDIGCTQDEGAVPYAGEWFAWFGGVADPEVAAVEQTVTIDGETAFLSFRFDINAAAGTGDDTFEVTIDDNPVFMVSDADMDAYDGYTPISIDISDFIDGGEHVVRFQSDHPGTGLTNFFLDEVALVTCVEGTGTSGSSGSSDTTSAVDESSSGSSDSTGGSSTGDSTTGESSSGGESSSSGT